MKVKIVIVFIFLVIILVSCTPQLIPTSTPTTIIASTNTPFPTPTPEQTSTPLPTQPTSPTPTPWNLEIAINSIPEIYTSNVSQEEIDFYNQLLSRLPIYAQYWTTNIGWGLEDFTLDKNEVELLIFLSECDDLDSLMILTSTRMIDGISQDDIKWAKGYKSQGLSEVFESDLLELIKNHLIIS